MLKETETEETIAFFVTFLSLVAFQLRGGGPPGSPSGYAYAVCGVARTLLHVVFKFTEL